MQKLPERARRAILFVTTVFLMLIITFVWLNFTFNQTSQKNRDWEIPQPMQAVFSNLKVGQEVFKDGWKKISDTLPNQVDMLNLEELKPSEKNNWPENERSMPGVIKVENDR